MKNERDSLWCRATFMFALLVLVAGIWFPEQIAASLLQQKPAMITPNSIDMGDIALNQKSTKTFVLLNPHFSTVYIRQMETSCGCTAASPAQKTVLPLQKVVCSVEIQASKKGVTKEYIVVKTDAGDREIPVTYNGI